jgi:hypothetical protein
MTQQYPPPGQPDPRQWQGYGGAHQAGPPPKPKRKKWPWILGAVVLLFVIVGVANSGDPAPRAGVPSGVGPTFNPTPAQVPGGLTEETWTQQGSQGVAPGDTPAAAAAPSGPASSFGNGQWSAPDEIKPGTYRSPGPEDSSVPLCYADTTPAAGGNIDQQQVSNGGPVRIRVKAGQIVKASGCQEFTKVG